MAKNSFLLVNLKENQTKQLAQVIQNESCRVILDHLADNSGTESEISKKLNLPISTVHYNLQALVKAGLVEADEFHYSQKGREVLHYKLANKYIIIAPKSTYGIKEKLKSILPIALFIGVAAFLIQAIANMRMFMGSGSAQFAQVIESTAMDQAVIEQGAKTAADIGTEAAAAAGLTVAETTSTTTTTIATTTTEAVKTIAEPNVALWFVMGAVTAFVIYLIVDYLISRKK